MDRIDELVWAHKPKLLKDYGYTIDSKNDGDTGWASTISGYNFGERNGIVNDMLTALGWYTKNDGHTLVYDMETITRARTLTEKIYDAYEAGYHVARWKYYMFYPYYFFYTHTHTASWSVKGNFSTFYVTPMWAKKYWDDLELGGDDDVDYNSTMLDIVFDMVEVAHKHNS